MIYVSNLSFRRYCKLIYNRVIRKGWRITPVALLCVVLSACVTDEEVASTVVTDDAGQVHYTLHYLRDKRGQKEFPLKIHPTGRKLFVFDPKIPAWATYDADGTRVMTGRASGGADYCADTNGPCRTVTGSFKVYRKRGEDCRSSEFPIDTEGGAKMPYCMYFFRGYTIHAGYGFAHGNTSHGCIRVLPSAAKWLNESFMTLGTQVVVLSYEKEDGDGDWLRESMT